MFCTNHGIVQNVLYQNISFDFSSDEISKLKSFILIMSTIFLTFLSPELIKAVLI